MIIQKSRENMNQQIKGEKVILTKEDREKNLLVKFRSSISTSLENLNIRNLIDLNKDNNEMNESLIENDNISIASSKYMHNRKNVKLPFIIGTNEYFKNEFLGIFNEELVNIPLGLKRKTDVDNILKNEFIENEMFTASIKDDVNKNNQNDNTIKLNPIDNLIDLSIQAKKVEEVTQNIHNPIVLHNIQLVPNPTEPSKDIINNEVINNNNVVSLSDRVVEDKPLINDPVKPSVISLNQFIKNPLFENIEEEDSLFKYKTKNSVNESKNLFEKSNNEQKSQISEKLTEPEKISLPVNLFTINEKDESKIMEEENKIKLNVKSNEIKENKLLKNFEEDKKEEKDEATKISEMKKKLNKFLVDIDNEELDLFGKANKQVPDPSIENRNENKTSTKLTKDVISLFNDPLSNDKEEENLFSNKLDLSHPNRKETTTDKPLLDNNFNKFKKPFVFKSSLLYDDDDEDLFSTKKKNLMKEPLKTEEDKTKINLPPLIGINKIIKTLLFLQIQMIQKINILLT